MIDSNFLAVTTTLSFVGWYAWRLHMLAKLKTERVSVTATVMQKLGRTVLCQYSDAAGKLHKKQIALSKELAGKIDKGSQISLLYVKSRPSFSCPAGSVDSSIKQSRRLLLAAVVFSQLLLLPVIFH